MRTRTKVMIAVAGLLGGAYWWLVREAGAPAHCSFSLDVARLRALAGSLPGDKPREVRVDRLVRFGFPDAVVVTGHGWGKTEMTVYVYQLVFADHTIVVDTGMTEPDAKKLGSGYDNDAWTRLERAMEGASQIYVTHEHADHLGGLARVAAQLPRVAVAARLTKEQLDNPAGLAPVVMPPLLAQSTPLLVDGAMAVAPGVVLVKAAGHTPGSQFVFVQTADGRELLFVGDTAWHRANIDEVRGPPRLVSLMMKNDRDAIACQLRALHDLGAAEPALHIVPGHDRTAVQALIDGKILTSGLQ